MWKKAVQKIKRAKSGNIETEKTEQSSYVVEEEITIKSEMVVTKKGSIIKKKQNSTEQEEPEATESGEIDPVYSLLKCAADLPKTGKPMCGLHPHCSGHHSGSSLKSAGDSSGNTSKTSSPSSSGMQDIVSQSLGGEFKSYYKKTSPAIKKTSSPFDIIQF